MHEFSIASEIVRNVLDVIEKNGLKGVSLIHLEIGEMAFINTQQVSFWVTELLKGTKAEGLKIKVRKIKAKIRCFECGFNGIGKGNKNWNPNHLIHYFCPKCGSFKVDFEKGRECLLKRIEGIK